MASEAAFPRSNIAQSVTGDRNIFTATGDVNVVYSLPQVDADDQRKLLILLNRVEQFWIEPGLERSMQNEAFIELGKETQLGVIERPSGYLELPNSNQRLLPKTRITDIFESAGRLLLILGEPGSGKTITLLELARDVAARAKIDPSQPIPVVFELSSWNERYKSLSDWLAEYLRTQYFIPKQSGYSWLKGNRLLLLLDGLDEVQNEMRVACIRPINAFLQDTRTSGIVVCSRFSEYVSAQVRLKMNGAICLQPFTIEQVATYMSSFGSELDALRVALSRDHVLRELAKTPLMLSVMTLAYQGASTSALSTDEENTAESRRAQIFDTYIHRMFARKGKQGSIYAKNTSIMWLSWLARRMIENSQTVFRWSRFSLPGSPLLAK